MVGYKLGIGSLDCGMRISECGLKKAVFGVRQKKGVRYKV